MSRFTIYRSARLSSYTGWKFSGEELDATLVDRWQDSPKVAQWWADREGYNLISATAVQPQLDNQFIFSVAMVVEPKYNARTQGVPGCCEPGAIPDHYPNPSCRSGKHPHCTCDGCF